VSDDPRKHCPTLAWRVAISEHWVSHRRIPAQERTITAPDALAARVAAIREVHDEAGVDSSQIRRGLLSARAVQIARGAGVTGESGALVARRSLERPSRSRGAGWPSARTLGGTP